MKLDRTPLPCPECGQNLRIPHGEPPNRYILAPDGYRRPTGETFCPHCDAVFPPAPFSPKEAKP